MGDGFDRPGRQGVMYSELIGEISVCTDCNHVHANGEITPDRDLSQPEPWSAIGFGYFATMGGEHADGCPNGPDGPRDTDCDCGDRGFRDSSCDGCGSYLAGDRFMFTLWCESLDEARNGFQRAIDSARTVRDTNRAAATDSLTLASMYRRFIADRFAEDKRFALWSARNAA